MRGPSSVATRVFQYLKSRKVQSRSHETKTGEIGKEDPGISVAARVGNNREQHQEIVTYLEGDLYERRSFNQLGARQAAPEERYSECRHVEEHRAVLSVKSW